MPLDVEYDQPRLRKQHKLWYLASLSHPQNEHIDPFYLAPWARTVEDFDHRLKITLPPTDADDDLKRKAAKAHLALVKPTWRDSQHIFAYTDGSQLDVDGQRCAGSGIVIYWRGQEIAALPFALGPFYEVYDAEMHALAQASR